MNILAVNMSLDPVTGWSNRGPEWEVVLKTEFDYSANMEAAFSSLPIFKILQGFLRMHHD